MWCTHLGTTQCEHNIFYWLDGTYHWKASANRSVTIEEFIRVRIGAFLILDDSII